MKKLIAIVAILLFVAAWYVVGAAVLMLAWNLVAGTAGAYTMSFMQALGLEVLGTLVLGVLSVSMRG